MSKIIPLLSCLDVHISATSLRQLSHLVFAMLCSPGRSTMLGLSRWTDKGGSYRTLQRLYQTSFNWLGIHWTLFQTHLLRPDNFYIVAVDEVVVSKAGRQTHGVGRFYSGLAQRVIPSVSFLGLSVVDVSQGQAYPLAVEQLMPPVQEPTVSQSKRPPGRPPGRKNYTKDAPQLSAPHQLLQTMLVRLTTQL